MAEPTEKQARYLALAGHPEIASDRVDPDGWLLVRYRVEIEVTAAVAGIEAEIGHRVDVLDSWIWLDTEGREHFGPGETGYDRFGLNG